MHYETATTENLEWRQPTGRPRDTSMNVLKEVASENYNNIIQFRAAREKEQR